MPNIIQITLISSISALTIALVLVAVYLIRLLKEISRTTQKLNQVLADAQTVTSSIAEPFSTLSQLLSGLKTGLDLLSHFVHPKDEEIEKSENTTEKTTKKSLSLRPRRFKVK